MAHYDLSLKDWLPVIPLPYSAPGEVGALPGSPRVAGVVFDFGHTPDQPLRRVALEAFAEDDVLSISLMLERTLVLGDDLVGPLTNSADEAKLRFVHRLRGGPDDR